MENKYLKWLSGKTQSIYWHDGAQTRGLEEAIQNGAVGATTNPFLIGAALQEDFTYWEPLLQTLPQDLHGDELAEALIGLVTAAVAKRMEVFRGQGKFHGFCCAQTNPCQPGHTEYIIEEAKRYAAYAENIVVKIPATRSGIEAIEECAALGMNVAATVSFTVPQALAVGAAVQRGIRRATQNGITPGIGIAVLMVGRLDDYLRDVGNDTRAAATAADICWAGTAAIKRAYELFNQRAYDCVLMPAGCRGGYHITELAGAKMVMSIAPKIAKQLELLDQKDFIEKIHIPVDKAIIDRLLTIREFRKAYEPDGMTEDEFITFGSCNRTLDQFVNCGWNVLQGIQY